MSPPSLPLLLLLLLPPPQATNPTAAMAVTKPKTPTVRSFLTLFPPVVVLIPVGFDLHPTGLIYPPKGQVKRSLRQCQHLGLPRLRPCAESSESPGGRPQRSDQLLQSLRKSGWITAELGSIRAEINLGTCCVPKAAR